MKFRLTSEFGALEEVRGGRIHHGIDLAMPEGTELRAIGDAVVEQVFDGSTTLGKGVLLRLNDGTHAIYGHMSDVNVEVGSKLSAGETLGYSGNTGFSTGPHLHFGMKAPDGEWLDPTPIAEQVAELSGELVGASAWSIFEPTGAITQWLFGKSVTETTKNTAVAILEGLREVTVELSGAIALVGGGVAILLYVGGWRDGLRWSGILFVARILIMITLGGV